LARSLAAALKLAQEQRARRPYLKVLISDKSQGVRRIRTTLFYDGASPDWPHGAACRRDLASSRIIRVRVDQGANQLDRQITTVPNAASDWGTWTTAVRAATRLCAIGCRPGDNDFLIAVTDNATPAQVHTSESTDAGASWGAFALAFTHTAAVTGIAVSYKSNGDAAIIYSDDSSNVYARRRLAGVWGAAVSALTAAPETVKDVTVVYSGDWNVVYATGARLHSRIFGDGFNQAAGTWSSERTILLSHNVNLVYRMPHIAQPDTYRLSFREIWSGTGAYSRIMLTQSPATADFLANLWKEPQPFAGHGSGYDHTRGLALADEPATPELYLLTNDRVYRAPMGLTQLDANPEPLDVTADVVRCDYREGERPLRTLLELDNADGFYDVPPLVITKGAEVRLSPGYYDAGNNALASDGPAVWIEKVEHNFLTMPPTLTLTCLNVWAYLERWVSPRVIQHAAGSKNAFAILQDFFARVGFEFSGSGASADSANLLPAVTIGAGERGNRVARRVLDRLADVVFTRSEFAFITEPLSSEAADWTFSRNPTSGQHELTNGRYRDGLRDQNHVRVLGGATGGVVGEAIDYLEVQLHYAAPFLVADRELTTATMAGNRAAATARKREIFARQDLIVAPVHAGLEVYDVIAVTDARVGLSAAKRRVTGLRLRYARGRSPSYTHELELGNP
jgi:hypothetical protein